MTHVEQVMLLAQGQDDAGGSGGAIIGLILAIAAIAGLWKTFTKAGKPGWAAIIPIYNFLVLLQVAGRPWWWLLLLLVPIVNLIIVIVVDIDVAKNFGKSALFGLGLAFLGFIFYPILGFGDARYAPVPK